MHYLFSIALLCLLLVAQTSSALTPQQINDIIAACSANHCATRCEDFIHGVLWCYCVDCKTSGTTQSRVITNAPTALADKMIYQMDGEQFVCQDVVEESRLLCSPLKLQVKVLDVQNLPTEGKDRDAADEILRIKSVTPAPKAEVVAPAEVLQPTQQPAKPATPFFRRSMPFIR